MCKLVLLDIFDLWSLPDHFQDILRKCASISAPNAAIIYMRDINPILCVLEGVHLTDMLQEIKMRGKDGRRDIVFEHHDIGVVDEVMCGCGRDV